MMQSMRSNGSRKIDLGPSSENTSAAHPRQDYELQIYPESCAGFQRSTIIHLLITLSLLGNADYSFVNVALENSA